MTKNDIAFRALKQLFPRLTKDSKVLLREMAYCIGNARDEAIKNNAWSMMTIGEDIIWDGMISPYSDNTLTKESDCLYYLELPAKPLYLPKNAGIYQVTSSEDPSNPIIPVRPTFNVMYRNSLAKELGGQNGYYQIGNRIYITTNNVTEDTKIDLLLIAQSEDIDDNAYFPFPADMENQIIKMAIEQFSPTVTIPEDNSDNSRDEPTPS